MTTIYIVGYCPGAGDGATGGFEWRRTPEEALAVAQRWLADDGKLASDYTIRAIVLPPSVNVDDAEDVAEWLDGDGFDLWNVRTQAPHMRQVTVTNVPVRGFVKATVSVEADLEGVGLQQAIAAALCNEPRDTWGAVEEVGLDEAAVNSGWEFQVEERHHAQQG